MNLKNSCFDFVAVFLILTLPFIEFIYTNNFVFEIVTAFLLAGYAAAALAVALLINKYPNRLVRAVILTAIITLFLDVRVGIFNLIGFEALFIIPALVIAIWLLYLNASTILIAIFGGIFAGIFFLPVLPEIEDYPVTRLPNGGQTAKLPVYVHIILDEHTGIEALDEEIDNQKDFKKSAKNLFIKNGFRLFGRAYSEYFDTYDSLPSALNSYRGLNPGKLYTRDGLENSFTLNENKYFRDLHKSGYAIQVYQSIFINYCDQSKDIIQQCLTYNTFGVSSRALAQLDTAEKLDVILSMTGFLYSKGILQQIYNRMAAFSARNGVSLPRWNFVDKDVGPIPVLPVFDQLISDVVNASPGTMFFAHLLLPHHPYVVDGNCKIRRPVTNWKKAELPASLNDGRVNTVSSRSIRFDEYIDQAGCALTKVDELIEAMQSAGKFEDSIIIVHSDHGSRITQFRPRIVDKDRLLRQDYYDGFSILFAVKAPHVAPGYDLRMFPLEQLLRYTQGDVPVAPESSEGPSVYLRDQPADSIFIKVPMPEIPGGTDATQGAND